MTGNSPHDPTNSGPSWPADTDFEALARYFAGESAEPEVAVVQAWLKAHPVEAARFAAIEAGVQSVAADLHATVDVETALRRVHSLRDQAPEAAAPSPRVVLSTSRGAGGLGKATVARGTRMSVPWARRAPFLAAATVAAIALGTFLLLRPRTIAGPSPTVESPRELATGVGQRDSLILADGSRILLGPLSRVTVAAGYGHPARTVELRGDALFDVRHDDAHPFVVHAGRAVIRDVGTTFTVEASDASAVRVVVTAGSVQLASTSADSGVLLRAGDVGRLRAGETPSAQPRSATDDDLAWTRGQLAFKNAPLTVVREELRRWYGIELVLADSSLRTRTLNTTFVRETPEQAMQIIQLMLGVRIEMRGDSAIVHRATSGGAPAPR